MSHRQVLLAQRRLLQQQQRQPRLKQQQQPNVMQMLPGLLPWLHQPWCWPLLLTWSAGLTAPSAMLQLWLLCRCVCVCVCEGCTVCVISSGCGSSK